MGEQLHLPSVKCRCTKVLELTFKNHSVYCVFSTLEDVQYIAGDITSTLEDVLSASGVVQYISEISCMI